MDWERLRDNLLPVAGLASLGVASIWFLASVTPWLDELPFSPWWLVATVVVLGIVLLLLVARLGLRWDTTDFDLAIASAGGLVVISAANIALGLWLKPWLEGLAFNPWWLALIAIPVVGVIFGLTWLILWADDESVAFLKVLAYGAIFSLISTGLVAANIALAFWLNSWLPELPFNPWWLLVPVSIVMLFLLILSGYAELLIWLLVGLALLLAVPLAAVTSLVWAPVLVIWAAFEEEVAEVERAPSGEGVWTDDEIRDIRDDSFYFQDYAEALVDRAEQAGMPLVIGIFGRWGSGKTSLMRLMERLLEEQPSLETLWINVWQLSNRQELWNAFLQSLLTRVHEALPWRRRLAFDWYLFRQRVRWGKLAQTLLVNSYRILIAVTPILLAWWSGESGKDAGQLLAIALDPLAAGTASLILGLWLVVRPAVEAARQTVSIDLDEILEEAPYEFQVSVLEQMRKDFEEMVRKWVGPYGRLVVFVDDLDRCSPDSIGEVFEALKLFTTAKNCVYVMGMDYDVVRDAINVKYDIRTEEAAEYLEKVFQIPFHLPPLEDDRIADFVKDKYPAVLQDCADAPQIFSLGLEPNPRKVKRALNVYRTVYNLAEERWWNWDMDHKVLPDLVVKVVVIQSRFQALHRALSREPSLIRQLDGWARWFSGADGDDQASVQAAQVQRAHERITELVAERDRRSLAEMLRAGSVYFDDLDQADANVYIYLTSAGEEAAEGTRPRREERGLLLGGELAAITEVVGEILERGRDSEQQQTITAGYLERLKGVINPPERDSGRRRFTVQERESANIALNQLEGIGPLQPLEPWTVRVPEGRFRMGYTGEDIEMLWPLDSDRQYEEILQRLREDEPDLYNFAKGFVEELERLLPMEDREPLAWVPDQVYEGLMLRRERRRQAREEGDEEPEGPWEGEQKLGEYSIGHYPVTNSQYLEFVRTTGYVLPSHLADGEISPFLAEDWPLDNDWFFDDGWFPTAYHPVVGVSWHDAMAYCKWLSQATGRSYGLPTEAEWEKAARGIHGQIFPWGNELDPTLCNTVEAEVYTTTEVGRYQDHSPYLAQDMVGNVWEWTQSLYRSYPYDASDGREDVNAQGDRVLRGGSFHDVLGAVSSATRHHADPGLKLTNVGFRVVMRLV